MVKYRILNNQFPYSIFSWGTLAFLANHLYFTLVKSDTMKYLSPSNIAKYLCNNFIGNFLGFVVGMASTRLVAHFYETKSIRNLWGLTAKKTVVSKSTFNNLQLVLSIVIGFIVFEIISKFVKQKMDELLPEYKTSFKNWLSEKLAPKPNSRIW